MHSEGNIFVKHITPQKCIKVSTWVHAPCIEPVNFTEINTGEFENFEEGEAQPIPKERFDIERQQVILQLING